MKTMISCRKWQERQSNAARWTQICLTFKTLALKHGFHISNAKLSKNLYSIQRPPDGDSWAMTSRFCCVCAPGHALFPKTDGVTNKKTAGRSGDVNTFIGSHWDYKAVHQGARWWFAHMQRRDGGYSGQRMLELPGKQIIHCSNSLRDQLKEE